MRDSKQKEHYGPIVAAGLLLGTGLGGFVDGILLHQILQWHNMLSSKLPPTNLVDMKVNMVWDGVFHAFTWIVTVVGLTLLFRAGRRADVPWSGRVLLGSMSAGWGLFNFVEGILDHHLLGLHHVHPGSQELGWDLAFLASGVALIGLGLALIQHERHVGHPPHAGTLHPGASLG
jgi:uncharacterized membrane protein